MGIIFRVGSRQAAALEGLEHSVPLSGGLTPPSCCALSFLCNISGKIPSNFCALRTLLEPSPSHCLLSDPFVFHRT